MQGIRGAQLKAITGKVVERNAGQQEHPKPTAAAARSAQRPAQGRRGCLGKGLAHRAPQQEGSPPVLHEGLCRSSPSLGKPHLWSLAAPASNEVEPRGRLLTGLLTPVRYEKPGESSTMLLLVARRPCPGQPGSAQGRHVRVQMGQP